MASESTQEAFSCFVHGSPCWIEIMAANPQKLQDFYAAVFPSWKFMKREGDDRVTHIMYEKPAGLTGGFVKLPSGSLELPAQSMGVGFTVYYLVNSIDETEKQIVQLGGKKVMDTKSEGHGSYANFQDPAGHRFGIYEVNKA